MMRMPAVIVSDHRDRDVTNFRFARQLRLLQIGHPYHVHAPRTVQIRFCFGGKLRAFHAEISSAALADDFGLLTCLANNFRKLRANGIGEGDMRDNAVAEESIHTVASTVHKLVGDDELQWLMLFLQRPDGRNGKNSLNAKLLETVDIRSEV